MFRELIRVFAGWIAVFTTTGCLAQETASSLPFTISPETTHVTGPLNADGRINFYQASIDLRSEGVTIKNNAARFILATLPDGYDGWTTNEMEQLRDDLDVGFLSMDYPTIVTVDEFVEKHDCHHLSMRFYDAIEHPFTADDQPLVAQYIAENTPAIDQIVESTKLKEFYVPLRPMGDADEQDDAPGGLGQTLIGLDIKHFGAVRHIARLIATRAMLRIGSGDYQDAWHDILAIRRLGRMVGSQETLIEGLVGIAITGIACHAARDLIVHAAASDVEVETPDWSTMRDEWGETFQTADLKSQFDVGERLMYLQIATMVADDEVGLLHSLMIAPVNISVDETGFSDAIEEMVRQLNENDKIDWDAGLRWANTYFDRMVEISLIEDIKERHAAGETQKQRMEDLETSLYPAGLVKLGADETSGEERAKVVCGVLLAVLAPAAGQIMHAEGRTQSNQKVIALSLASLQYRSDNKTLPNEPGQLAKQFESSNVLVDSVSGEPLELTHNDELFRITYHCALSTTLDFEIEIVKSQK